MKRSYMKPLMRTSLVLVAGLSLAGFASTAQAEDNAVQPSTAAPAPAMTPMSTSSDAGEGAPAEEGPVVANPKLAKELTPLKKEDFKTQVQAGNFEALKHGFHAENVVKTELLQAEDENGVAEWKITFNAGDVKGDKNRVNYTEKNYYNIMLSKDLDVVGNFHVKISPALMEDERGLSGTSERDIQPEITLKDGAGMLPNTYDDHREERQAGESRLSEWVYWNAREKPEEVAKVIWNQNYGHIEASYIDGADLSVIKNIGHLYRMRHSHSVENIPHKVEVTFKTKRNPLKMYMITNVDLPGARQDVRSTFVSGGFKSYERDLYLGLNTMYYNHEGSDVDTDLDGLPDLFEKAIGTDPSKPDTDGDGIQDAQEFGHTNPDLAAHGFRYPTERNSIEYWAKYLEYAGTDPRVDTPKVTTGENNELKAEKGETVSGTTSAYRTVTLVAKGKDGVERIIGQTISDASGNYNIEVGKKLKLQDDRNAFNNMYAVEGTSVQDIRPVMEDVNESDIWYRPEDKLTVKVASDMWDGGPLFATTTNSAEITRTSTVENNVCEPIDRQPLKGVTQISEWKTDFQRSKDFVDKPSKKIQGEQSCVAMEIVEPENADGITKWRMVISEEELRSGSTDSGSYWAGFIISKDLHIDGDIKVSLYESTDSPRYMQGNVHESYFKPKTSITDDNSGVIRPGYDIALDEFGLLKYQRKITQFLYQDLTTSTSNQSDDNSATGRLWTDRGRNNLSSAHAAGFEMSNFMPGMQDMSKITSAGDLYRIHVDSTNTETAAGKPILTIEFSTKRTPLDVYKRSNVVINNQKEAADKSTTFVSAIAKTYEGNEIAVGMRTYYLEHTGLNVDSDEDGLPNVFENLYGTNPNNPDSDCDGKKDGAEFTGDGGFRNYVSRADKDLPNLYIGTDPLVPQPTINEKTSVFTGEVITGKTQPNQTVHLYLLDPSMKDVSDAEFPEYMAPAYANSAYKEIGTAISDDQGNYRIVVGKVAQKLGPNKTNKYGNDWFIKDGTDKPELELTDIDENIYKEFKAKHQLVVGTNSDGWDGRPSHTAPEISDRVDRVPMNEKFDGRFNEPITIEGDTITPQDKGNIVNKLSEFPGFEGQVQKVDVDDTTGKTTVTFTDGTKLEFDANKVINAGKTKTPSAEASSTPAQGDTPATTTIKVSKNADQPLPFKDGDKITLSYPDPKKPGETISKEYTVSAGADAEAKVDSNGVVTIDLKRADIPDKTEFTVTAQHDKYTTSDATTATLTLDRNPLTDATNGKNAVDNPTTEAENRYNNALDEAKKVLGDPSATQEDLDKALKELKDAEKYLEEDKKDREEQEAALVPTKAELDEPITTTVNTEVPEGKTVTITVKDGSPAKKNTEVFVKVPGSQTYVSITTDENGKIELPAFTPTTTEDNAISVSLTPDGTKSIGELPITVNEAESPDPGSTEESSTPTKLLDAPEKIEATPGTATPETKVTVADDKDQPVKKDTPVYVLVPGAEKPVEVKADDEGKITIPSFKITDENKDQTNKVVVSTDPEGKKSIGEIPVEVKKTETETPDPADQASTPTAIKDAPENIVVTPGKATDPFEVTVVDDKGQPVAKDTEVQVKVPGQENPETVKVGEKGKITIPSFTMQEDDFNATPKPVVEVSTKGDDSKKIGEIPVVKANPIDETSEPKLSDEDKNKVIKVEPGKPSEPTEVTIVDKENNPVDPGKTVYIKVPESEKPVGVVVGEGGKVTIPSFTIPEDKKDEEHKVTITIDPDGTKPIGEVKVEVVDPNAPDPTTGEDAEKGSPTAIKGAPENIVATPGKETNPIPVQVVDKDGKPVKENTPVYVKVPGKEDPVEVRTDKDGSIKIPGFTLPEEDKEKDNKVVISTDPKGEKEIGSIPVVPAKDLDKDSGVTISPDDKGKKIPVEPNKPTDPFEITIVDGNGNKVDKGTTVYVTVPGYDGPIGVVVGDGGKVKIPSFTITDDMLKENPKPTVTITTDPEGNNKIGEIPVEITNPNGDKEPGVPSGVDNSKTPSEITGKPGEIVTNPGKVGIVDPDGNSARPGEVVYIKVPGTSDFVPVTVDENGDITIPGFVIPGSGTDYIIIALNPNGEPVIAKIPVRASNVDPNFDQSSLADGSAADSSNKADTSALAAKKQGADIPKTGDSSSSTTAAGLGLMGVLSLLAAKLFRRKDNEA